MKKLPLIIVFAGFTWAIPVYAQDTTGNRMVAAEKYIDSVDIGQMINGAIAQMAQNLSSDKRQAFARDAQKGLDIQRLRNLMINSMVQVFTVDELNLLAEFYGSGTGKSIMKKFPEYMSIAMPMIQAELKRAVGKN